MGAVKEKSDEMDSKKEWRRKQAEGRARASANAARVRMSERETAEKGASMYALYSNGFKDEEHIHCVVRVTWYCLDRTNHNPLISPRTVHTRGRTLVDELSWYILWGGWGCCYSL